MKKVLNIHVVIVLLAGIFLLSTSQFVSADTQNTVTIKAREVIDFPIKTLPEKIQLEYRFTGWTITDSGAYREVVLKNGEIYIDHQSYSLNETGRVSFRSASVGGVVSTDHHGMRATEIQEINGEKVAIFEVNMGELFDHMDEQHFATAFRKGYGDKYSPGDWVHCNRFNGPATDDVHYPKSNPRAWINFVGSDCDLALISSTVCWGHSYCNQRGPAGGCSLVIGRSPRYHRN